MRPSLGYSTLYWSNQEKKKFSATNAEESTIENCVEISEESEEDIIVEMSEDIETDLVEEDFSEKRIDSDASVESSYPLILDTSSKMWMRDGSITRQSSEILPLGK